MKRQIICTFLACFGFLGLSTLNDAHAKKTRIKVYNCAKFDISVSAYNHKDGSPVKVPSKAMTIKSKKWGSVFCYTAKCKIGVTASNVGKVHYSNPTKKKKQHIVWTSKNKKPKLRSNGCNG